MRCDSCAWETGISSRKINDLPVLGSATITDESTIRERAEMGFTHMIFNMPDLYEMQSLKTFAREIIPAAGGI